MDVVVLAISWWGLDNPAKYAEICLSSPNGKIVCVNTPFEDIRHYEWFTLKVAKATLRIPDTYSGSAEIVATAYNEY